MGFNPDYKSRRVATAHKCLDDSTISEIRNVRVFDGYMSVLHSGIESTELSNDTSVDVEWEAAFKGDYAYIESGGSLYPAETHTDLKGNVFSKALIPVAANAKVVRKSSEYDKNWWSFCWIYKKLLHLQCRKVALLYWRFQGIDKRLTPSRFHCSSSLILICD